MRKSIYTIIAFALLLFTLSCNEDNSGNNSKTGNKVTNNKTVNNKSKANKMYAAPSELQYMSKKEGFSYDKFYPVGWSDDGKFAYVVEPVDENSGLYFFEIHIYDIVNNKEVWTWKYESEDGGSVQSVWNKNADLLSESLNEYNIIQTKKMALKKSKMSYKGNDYEILMDTKLETDQDFGIDIVKGLKLSMKSPQLGAKDFFEQQMDNRDYILSAYVPGLLMSPKGGDRVAVICQKERVGAAGPPNVVFFEIVGTNLSTGFTKN